MSKTVVGHFTEFVGKRIANRRRAKKIAPEDLARRIGVSAVVLDNMEHGSCHINLEQLMQCAKSLGPVGELLGLPHYSDEQMLDFVDKRVRAMSKEQLEAWQQDTEPQASDRRRLYILDMDLEQE